MVTAFRKIGQSKLFSLLAKFSLTLAAFAYVFSNINFFQLSEIFHAQEHSWLIATALLTICQIVLGAMRWRMIAVALSNNDKQSMTVYHGLKFYYISTFFNSCLPGTVGGDVVRVWLVKSDRFPLSLSIYSVVIDRIISLLALFVLILLTLPLFGEIAGFTLWPIIIIIIAGAVFGLWILKCFDRLFGRYSHYRLIQIISYFIGCLRMLLVHRRASELSLLCGIIAHLCFCLCGYLLAHSLSVQMTLLQAITLMPPVLLATTLPISIGGWGVREAGMVGLLGLIGVPKAVALIMAVQLGILYVLLSLPAGLLWLVNRRRGTAAQT